MGNLNVELTAKEDKNGSTYYLGRLKFPGEISLENTTLIVFVSESGSEVLQVAVNNKENATFSKYSVRDDRLRVALDERKDSLNATYYISKLNIKGSINCRNELVFIIFISAKNNAEIQLVGEIAIDGFSRNNVEYDDIKDCLYSASDDPDHKELK